ncbi:hypothetical protein [Bradyrhizobium nanningense]|uniref:hypothetical protein n=1 Tax=Bradyrhizobium nanningense TaxID=1325118 RepID=UPI0010090B11|nr:hypothetical protein [Bradyrhizobium nanningense]
MSTWKKRARSAMLKLRNAKRGETESILSAVGQGINPNTVRREVQALAFLDDLRKSDPAISRRLRVSSFGTIELLARWSSFDPRGAAEEARKVASKEHSLKSLKSALQSAMERHSVPTRLGFLQGIEPSVRSQICRILGGNLAPLKRSEKALGRAPIDFFYQLTQPGTADKCVAVLVVGPYRYVGQYSKRRQEELWRAMGLAWAFDHVVVVLPERRSLIEYQRWLAEYAFASPARTAEEENTARMRRPSVHVIGIN